MSILKIARLGHPVLHKKATIVKNFPNPTIQKLIKDMIETMFDSNGIGLAAPQVHVSKQVMIFRILEEESKVFRQQYVLIQDYLPLGHLPVAVLFS